MDKYYCNTLNLKKIISSLEVIEFKKLRYILNEYRFNETKLDKDRSRCINLANKILDIILNQKKSKEN